MNLGQPLGANGLGRSELTRIVADFSGRSYGQVDKVLLGRGLRCSRCHKDFPPNVGNARIFLWREGDTVAMLCKDCSRRNGRGSGSVGRVDLEDERDSQLVSQFCARLVDEDASAHAQEPGRGGRQKTPYYRRPPAALAARRQAE